MPATTTRTLATSPAMCAKALEAFSPMEQSIFFEAWAVQDAMAAHELLAILQELSAVYDAGDFSEPYCTNRLELAWDAVKEWVQP